MPSKTLRGLAALVALLTLAAPATAQAASAPALKFGMAADDAADLAALGAPADYGQLWAGVWNERSGWQGVAQQAKALADQGVTPVIEWWYWGDDISRTCVAQGCLSQLHGAWKSQAGWTVDSLLLASALHEALQGRPAVLVLETEFNKGRMGEWEDFDGLLAAQAELFRERAPELRLVLGFGNWGREHWGTFDRTVAAVDAVGLQSLRGSTRDSAGAYVGAVDELVAGAQRLHQLFSKPVLVHDVAWSSWPAASHEGYQQFLLTSLFARLPDLRDAGVEGVVYRALDDHPRMDLANYYGEAERHMGLRRADGTGKPTLQTWLDGVAEERARAAAPVFPLAASWWSWGRWW